MHPLVADGGELTVLRDLAAFAFGRWQVEWPDSVPEENRPVIADDREQGFVYKMPKSVGRMGRRFVRADASINAADFDGPGRIKPGTGFSNVESVLDAALRRTQGESLLERDITRAGLGRLRPYEDFDVDDVVPVEIWGKVIDLPVTSIEAVTSLGAVVDWRVHVGGSLLGDASARDAANEELRRQIAVERRERAGEVERARLEAAAAHRAAEVAHSAADVAHSVADGARVSASAALERAAVLARALSGRGATPESVLSDLQRLNRQLQQAGEGGATDQGLIPAYINANTKRWELQAEVDRLQNLQILTTRAQVNALTIYADVGRTEIAASGGASTQEYRNFTMKHHGPLQNIITIDLKPSRYVTSVELHAFFEQEGFIAPANQLVEHKTLTKSDPQWVVEARGIKGINQATIWASPVVDLAAIFADERRKLGI